MKKIFFAAITALIYTFSVNAQFGVQAGAVGIPGEAFPTADGTDKLGGTLGFTLGVFYQMPLGGGQFAFQPALNFLNKNWGDELTNETTGAVEDTKQSVNYLELPLQFVYTGGKEKGFFAGAGPSVLIGMGGKYKIERSNGQNVERDYNFGSDANLEGPVTIGLNAMVGYNFNGLMVGLNYGMGITNRDTPVNVDFGNQAHFALRVGYLLGKAKK